MESCRPKLPLAARPLIGALEAERVGTLFKSLAHPTRLRLLHALIRVDELSVGDLADETGMTVQARYSYNAEDMVICDECGAYRLPHLRCDCGSPAT